MLCLLEQLPGSCFGAEVSKETEVLAKRLQGFLVTLSFWNWSQILWNPREKVMSSLCRDV